jgi:hypothetical protein
MRSSVEASWCIAGLPWCLWLSPETCKSQGNRNKTEVALDVLDGNQKMNVMSFIEIGKFFCEFFKMAFIVILN